MKPPESAACNLTHKIESTQIPNQVPWPSLVPSSPKALSGVRLQRWRTVGEGPQYLKIVGKVLYRLKDIEAYEEACLIRKVF